MSTNFVQHNATTARPAQLWQSWWLPYALLILLCIIAYGNTVSNGYAFDDFTVTYKNTIVTKGFSGIAEIFTTPYRKGYIYSLNDLYRPLSMAMFAAEASLWGFNAPVDHAINVLIFAACVVALYRFLVRLCGNSNTLPLVAAILFALHPIHTEVVANVKSRDELLCFLFAFLSLNAFAVYAASGRLTALVAGVFCYSLALFSKETAAPFVIITPAIFIFWLPADNRRRVFAISAGVVVVLALFLFVRQSILAAYHANGIGMVRFIDNQLAFTGIPSSTQQATAMLFCGWYLKLLFVPWPLLCDYTYASIPYVTFSDVSAWLSLLAYLGICALAVFRFIKKRSDIVAFAIFFYMCCMAMFSNMGMFFNRALLIAAPVSERFLFFSSVGFCIAIAWVLQWALKPRPGKYIPLLMVLLPVCTVYAGITINRNTDWIDNYTLFTTDVKKAPENSKLSLFAGDEMISRAATEPNSRYRSELRQEGLELLKQGFLIYYPPNATIVYPDLAPVALEYDHALTLMASTYYQEGQYRQAMAVSKLSYQAHPADADRSNNLGLCFFNLAMYDSAIHYLNIAKRINPGLNTVYLNLARSYKAMGLNDSAQAYEAITRHYFPGFKLETPYPSAPVNKAPTQ